MPSTFLKKEQIFNIFLDHLLEATEKIDHKYFELPVYNQDQIYRERVYCYELYYHLRSLLPEGFPYTLSGEVSKSGHPLISSKCGKIVPDFLVHIPGAMDEDSNLAIIEVKSIMGADPTNKGGGLLKDLKTINCMTNISNGYFRGIILVFGSNCDDKKTKIKEVYRNELDVTKTCLVLHHSPRQRAEIVFIDSI